MALHLYKWIILILSSYLFVWFKWPPTRSLFYFNILHFISLFTSCAPRASPLSVTLFVPEFTFISHIGKVDWIFKLEDFSDISPRVPHFCQYLQHYLTKIHHLKLEALLEVTHLAMSCLGQTEHMDRRLRDVFCCGGVWEVSLKACILCFLTIVSIVTDCLSKLTTAAEEANQNFSHAQWVNLDFEPTLSKTLTLHYLVYICYKIWNH